MRDVAIIGVGSTPFGKLERQGIVEMAVAACRDALAESRVPREKIQALYLGNFAGERLASQGSLAAIVVNRLGMSGIPATKTEGACASGGIAFRLGVLGIALGLYDFVLVGGVEKMSSAPTAEVTAALATAGDETAEMRTGLTFPGAFGIIMREHMARYGTTRAQIGLVSVKNHGLGAANPKAQFRKPVTLDEVVSSRLVADPIRLFDCPPISDGAAAAVLCPLEMARDFTAKPVRVLGTGHATGPATLWESADVTTMPATVRASREAYAAAKIAPADVDVVELHDCFTIAEIIATEDLGLFPKGKGGAAVEEGWTALGGKVAVNPSGGLISKGHPVGATGVAQIYELVRQLRDEAANQVRGAEIALAHNLGGTGVVSTVTVLGRA
ncbi:MAG: thiolase domain-containing protein [Candidatus Rokubacteria bacterium]|nr:thiolase domain-containing protein [Candidatus Rokubacteria bacterium]MBI3825684.1 thiolase domain-containing protein [Candidatus Rokubacteria bacterium]